MRRPLALVGCVTLLVLLAAARWPAGVCIPLAGLLAAAFLLLVLLLRGKKQAPALRYIALGLATAAAALCFRAGYDLAVVQPLQRHVGNSYLATVHVRGVREGYTEETQHATVEVVALEGAAVRPFTVTVPNLPGWVEVGQNLELALSFGSLRSGYNTRSYYSAGQYLAVDSIEDAWLIDTNPDWLDTLRRLQYAASANIRAALPQRLSNITAAITVGDRRFLDSETKYNYRMAGLSHIMVVSGLHLTLACGGLVKLLRRFFRSRRVTGATGILAALGFMCFTGLAPSVVRAAVMFSILMLAPMLSRRADTLTSLGFAALVLCLQNPYAPADIGLLLSFSATLGAVGAGVLQRKLKRRFQPEGLPGRMLRAIAAAALLPVCVTFATLPVVAAYNLGVSLLALPMNLVAVPLLPFVVVTGFAMAIPPAWPVVGLLVKPAAFFNGVAMVWLERLTGWCAGQGWAYVRVAGSFVLVVILLVYLLVWRGVKTRRFALHLGTAAACLLLAVGLHTALARDTVTVTLAGNTSPSVVVSQNGEAVILYRGGTTDYAIAAALDEQGVDRVVLVVDLRRAAQGTQYEAYNAGRVILLEEVTSHTALAPFGDISLGIRRQGGGSLVYIDVAGTGLAAASGSVDVSVYPPIGYVLGGGTVTGHEGGVVSTGLAPTWADAESLTLVESGGGLWLRPGGGVRIQEVRDGELDG